MLHKVSSANPPYANMLGFGCWNPTYWGQNIARGATQVLSDWAAAVKMRVDLRTRSGRPVRLLSFVLAVAALMGACRASAGPPQRVIWVVIDSLRADHLHYMGYEKETSPWLDAFARESADFRLAIAPSHVTRRSAAGYMTGKYGHDLLDVDPPRHIPNAERTVAELFQEAGYRTVAWVTNPKLAPGIGFEQGFDEYHVLQPHAAPKSSIDEINDRVRSTHASYDGKAFIYIHTMDVHLPYRPPSPYDRMFAPPYTRPVVRQGAAYERGGGYILSNFPYFSTTHDLQSEDVAYLVSQYDGAIRYTDARLSELFDVLEYDPARDLAIITSDHGEQFFEHGFWTHGKLMFPEEIHVPLLVQYAALKPGPRTQPASLLDLYPTLAELLGTPVPLDLAGSSLVGRLPDEAPIARYVVSEHQHRLIPAAVVVGDGFLYRLNGNAHHRYPWRLWPFIEELYNLDADRGCRNNLAGGMSEAADRFNAFLRARRPRLAAYTPDLIRGADDDVKLGPDLFEASDGPWRTTEQEPVKLGAGGLILQTSLTQAHRRALVDEPGHAHLIEVQFQLASGAVFFRLQNTPVAAPTPVVLDALPGHPAVSWHYGSSTADNTPRNVCAVVYPRSTETYLVASLAAPGRATVLSARLRRAYLPEPATAYKLPPPEKRSAGPYRTPEERARLEGLGYIE